MMDARLLSREIKDVIDEVVDSCERHDLGDVVLWQSIGWQVGKVMYNRAYHSKYPNSLISGLQAAVNSAEEGRLAPQINDIG